MSKPKMFWLDGYSEKFSPSIGMDKQLRVVEAGPLLDLLERWHQLGTSMFLNDSHVEQATRATKELLSECGRLR